MRPFKSARTLFLLAALAGAVTGCTKSSPTEPSRPTPNAPLPPDAVVTFTVTVTATPAVLQTGTNNSSSIVVQVRRNDNGQNPPDLTPITLNTSLGEFGSVGSGQQTVALQLVGGQARAVLFPGTSAGTAVVRATVDGSTSAGAANIQIGQQATFFISSVTPGVGSPDGGEEVTINGGGFDQPVRVTFNGAAATVRSVSANSIRVVVPSAIAAGVTVGVGQSVPVSVGVTINVNETGQATDTLANGFTYSLTTSNRQPQIFSISPTSGSNDGGTRVTIVGQNFESPLQVFFGTGNNATTFDGVEATLESVSANQIVAITPAARGFGSNNSNKIVNLLVKNVNSGLSAVSVGLFRYGTNVQITSFAPGQAIYNVPTTVTIFGNGFSDPAAVGLGGFAATVLSVSGTEIVVRSPVIRVTSCADVSGQIVVTNINDGNSASIPGPFVYRVPKPVVGNLQPNLFAQSGGTSVTIHGANFIQPLRVLIGGLAATINSVSADGTQIVATVPSYTQPFPTLPCDDNQDGTQGQRNQDVSVDVQVINLETTCTDTATKALTYHPSDTTCRNDTGTPPAVAQCADGIDNDGDGLIDFGPAATNDPQCTSAADNDERN